MMNRVVSHNQGLEQCKEWLTTNVPDASLESVNSTAKGAQIVAEDDSDSVACVANLTAGEQNNLHIVNSGIESSTTNVTR